MRKLMLLLPFVIFALSLNAQSVNKEAINTATTAAAQTYQLNEQQIPKMYKIQERKLRNLAEIESLRSSNYELFLKKKNAIREGTQTSVQRLLTKEQMPILQAQMLDRRKRESSLIQQMKQEGASMEAIQRAILEME